MIKHLKPVFDTLLDYANSLGIFNKHQVTLAGMLAVGACATPVPTTTDGAHPAAQTLSRQSTIVTVGAWAYHEDCVSLSARSSLTIRFQASNLLAFDTHYHENETLIYARARRYQLAAVETFSEVKNRDYCFGWENPNAFEVELKYSWKVD